VSAVSANDIWVLGNIFPELPGRSSNALAHWTRQLVPSLNQNSTQIMAMSWIPGTTSAWSAGELAGKNGTQGVILRYQS
jgi:hypothetical protein